MKDALLKPEIKEFIHEHRDEEITNLILKGSPFPDVDIREIAMQIEGAKKAKKKLPLWFAAKNILYPKKQNLAQTSSETTAKYKARLVDGKNLVDLTGGFGVDSHFFSQKFEKVFHCELDSELIHLAEHNSNYLSDQKNIEFFNGDSTEFLQQSTANFDWIYVDPSRRTKTGNKVFRLEDCAPNVVALLPLYFEKTSNILIKTAPLLDINMGISELRNTKEIHIVAVSNEVKELLWILSKEKPAKEIPLKTINFTPKETVIFDGGFFEEKTKKATCSQPLNYLYEPNAAILKSGLYNSLCENFGIPKLHANTHLYTSEKPVDFPGRRFEIVEKFPFKPKTIKRQLGLEKANISVRNFPKSVEQIKKQFGIKDGGENYLFFTTDMQGRKIVLSCLKL